MFNLIVFLCLIALGFGVGSYIEKAHYAHIKAAEQVFLNLPAMSSKEVHDSQKVEAGELVYGSVVISLDYFKRFLAGLRFLFGGRVGAYETLLDRGRREAILRMKMDAQKKGFTSVVNMRFETSSIGNAANSQGSVGCFEVLAYGTGIKENG